MLEEFQAFSKKIMFNIFFVSVLAGLFQFGQLNSSSLTKYNSDSDSDEDGSTKRVKRPSIAPMDSPFDGDDEESQEYQDFLSLKPLSLLSERSPVKKPTERNNLVSPRALHTLTSTTFPDIAKKRSPFITTNVMSNKSTTRDLADLPFIASKSSPRQLFHSDNTYRIIPRPPALTERQRNSHLRLSARLPKIDVELPEDELPKIHYPGEQKSRRELRKVAFVGSSDVQLSELNDESVAMPSSFQATPVESFRDRSLRVQENRFKDEDLDNHE